MKVEAWFIFALVAFLAWGFWGFFPKLAVNYISPKSALVWEVLGGLLVGIGVLVMLGFRPETNPKGIFWAIMAGVAALIGGLFFLFAVKEGKASVVVATTALYPIITILLSFFILHEQITVKQGIGIVLALTAMLLFAI